MIYANKGSTRLWVVIGIIVEIADRAYVLEDAKIALEGGKEILQDQKIKNIYFGGR